MIYIPIIGSLALATGTIMEKIILMNKKVSVKLYQTASFLGILIIMFPFIYFFWRMTPEAFELKNIIILGLVIIFALIANLFTFFSMKWEKISNLEPAKILEPLFIISLAILFSFFIDSGLYGRNLKVIIPALIAAGALIFSHIRKHHLNFNKYFSAAIAGSFFYALELIISRLILDYYSPITFYFLRSFGIFIISFILFRPKFFNDLDAKVSLEILGISAIWFIYRIVIYYGYTHLGVISTTLIIMIGPIFIYIFAWSFLKEKLHWKNIVAAVIIIASVIYALLG